MTPWVVNITNVLTATGDLTQLYPQWLAVGVAGNNLGDRKRYPSDGVLYETSIYPTDGEGGILELWDVAGPHTGSPNVNTGTQFTNAYLLEQQARAAFRARLIWSQEFKGDAGLTTKKFTQRVPVMWGLAARFINPDTDGGPPTAGTIGITLNLVVGSCYKVVGRI